MLDQAARLDNSRPSSPRRRSLSSSRSLSTPQWSQYPASVTTSLCSIHQYYLSAIHQEWNLQTTMALPLYAPQRDNGFNSILVEAVISPSPSWGQHRRLPRFEREILQFFFNNACKNIDMECLLVYFSFNNGYYYFEARVISSDITASFAGPDPPPLLFRL